MHGTLHPNYISLLRYEETGTTLLLLTYLLGFTWILARGAEVDLPETMSTSSPCSSILKLAFGQ